MATGNISKLDLLSPEPLLFQNKLKIYKPKLKDIVAQGVERFQRNAKLLTITPLELAELNKKNDIDGTTMPLQYLIQIASLKDDPVIFLELEVAFITFLKSPVQFFDDHIEVTQMDENEMSETENSKIVFSLTNENFSEFQHYVRSILANEPDEEEEYDINTDNEAMRKMFLEKRLLLKQAKEKQRLREARNNSGNGLSLGDMVSGLCAFGTGYTMANIWDLTIYQLKDQFERCQKKEKFFYDYSAILQGADSKKIKLENWLK